MKRKLVTFAVFISLGFAAYGACNVSIEKAELAEADPIKIIVKPGKDALQKAIRKSSGIEGAVIIEMDGGEYRTEQTIEISPGKWSSLLIRNKAGKNVSVSGDKIIPQSRIKPVTDRSVLSRLPEEVRGKVVEVDCKGIVDKLDNIHASGLVGTDRG